MRLSIPSLSSGLRRLRASAEQPHMPQPDVNPAVSPLEAGQWDLYQAHIFRLDPQTRRCRFGMDADDAFLDQYLRSAPDLGTKLFAFVEHDTIRASAELRPVDRKTSAEATICVEDGWRKMGIGSALMRQILIAAHSTCISEIYVGCQASNRAMLRLASKFDADITIHNGTMIGLLNAGIQ